MSNTAVPIATAAEQAGVDIAQIHRWAAVGGLQLQGRGGKEFVRLDQVLALSAATRRRDPARTEGPYGRASPTPGSRTRASPVSSKHRATAAPDPRSSPRVAT